MSRIPPATSMRRPARLLLAIALLALPAAAAAQFPGGADSVTVSLWPEFDRREVLVIVRVMLPEGTPLPVSIAVPIPADAPDLTAVAYRQPGSQLLNAPYERIDGQPADIVQVETSGLEIHLEYYAPLSLDGDRRAFTFAWPGGLAAAQFEFEVQQPFGAEALELEPAATRQTSDTLGLIYHLVEIGSIAAADRPAITFGYRKTSPELSAEVGAAPAVLAPAAPVAGTPVNFAALLPYALLVAGVGLVAAGVVYYLRSRRPTPRSRPRHRPAASRGSWEGEVDASPVFCHSCGAQAAVSDRFCRRCGTALRT